MMNGAVLTRFHSKDYKVFFAPDLYAGFLKKLEASGLGKAIDDTKPGMLYYRGSADSFLWITGIPSSRKDRIGTPIRFNLLLADRDAAIRGWIPCILSLLSSPEREGLRRLGEAWDALIADNQAFLEYVGFSCLFASLEQAKKSMLVPPLSLEMVQDYLLLSPLIREAVVISDVLADKSLQGAVWNQGRLEYVPAAKKKIFSSVRPARQRPDSLRAGDVWDLAARLGHSMVENLHDLVGSRRDSQGTGGAAGDDRLSGSPRRDESVTPKGGWPGSGRNDSAASRQPGEKAGRGHVSQSNPGRKEGWQKSEGERAAEDRQNQLVSRIARQWDDITSAQREKPETATSDHSSGGGTANTAGSGRLPDNSRRDEDVAKGSWLESSRNDRSPIRQGISASQQPGEDSGRGGAAQSGPDGKKGWQKPEGNRAAENRQGQLVSHIARQWDDITSAGQQSEVGTDPAATTCAVDRNVMETKAGSLTSSAGKKSEKRALAGRFSPYK